MDKGEREGRAGRHGNPEEEQKGRMMRRRAEEEEAEEIYCGIGPCRPHCLQGCVDIKFVTVALCLAGLSTSTLSVYINSQITTLERQFGFSSSVSGVLLSCNDLGYLLTTLFMSYLARRLHILRALSLSTFLFGLSGLLCTVPFFASLPHLPPAQHSSSSPPSHLSHLHHPPGAIPSAGAAGVGSAADVASPFNFSRTTSAGSAGGVSGRVDVISGAGNAEGEVFSSRRESDGGFNASVEEEDVDVEGVKGPFSEYLCLSSPDSQFGGEGGEGRNGSSDGGFPSQEKGRCGDGGSEKKHRGTGAVSEDQKWMAVVLIGLGMVFQGFGKSPRQPFVGTYIDDNVPKTKTTLYLGIVSSCYIFGPVMAFTLGGLFSKMYLTLEDTTMTPRDPRWVGAWWLGFLAFGLLGILASIPTLFFPRRLKPQPHLRQLEADRKRASAKGNKCCYEFKEFFKCLLRLLRTPVYLCSLCGTCCILFGVAGMVAFMPKYLETQFMIPAWKANIILGVINALSAAGGTLIGGIVTSRLKMSPRTCLKVIIATSIVAAIFISSGFFLGCDQPDISMGASAGASWEGEGEEGVMTCRSSCQCDDTRFFPTCGADDVTYFSPCHAGCSHSHDMSFSNCSCVINSTMTSPKAGVGTLTTSLRGGVEATPGFCTPKCGMLYPFAAMNFFMAFTATLMIMPSFIVTVRSVSESDKPLAIGLSAFSSSLFGWFLGPIVYGRIADASCLLWSTGCEGVGSCSHYDLRVFRNSYHIAHLCSRIAGCVFYCIALALVASGRVKFAPHKDDRSEVIKDTLPAEAEKLMLETRGKGMMGNGDDDTFRFMGGDKIYKGRNDVV